jgi:hypothetical protein
LCEYLKHRRVGGFGWIAQYEAMVMRHYPGDYSYLAGWYSGLLDELCAELGERELEHICKRLQRRQDDRHRWNPGPEEAEHE